MKTKEQILPAIKTKIIGLLPDASVILFGSRASDTTHEESDWISW